MSNFCPPPVYKESRDAFLRPLAGQCPQPIRVCRRPRATLSRQFAVRFATSLATCSATTRLPCSIALLKIPLECPCAVTAAPGGAGRQPAR